MRYIQSFSTSGAVQDALDNGLLGQPYVAFLEDIQELDWNTLTPVPPVETRMKITYNFETTDETLVLANMFNLFGDATGKAEFPDGTEFIYDPEVEYETSDIKYTPSTIGIASIYYTFTGDAIGDNDDGSSLLNSFESGEIVPAISFEIPDQVNTIATGVFGNAAYTAITIPNHALTIGGGAFYTIDGGLVSINNGENTIPSGSVLGGGAFYGQALEEITIGQGVTFGLNREDGDFGGCQSLTSITFLDTTPPSIDTRVFNWMRWDDESGVDVSVDIYVPVGYEQAYASSFTQDYYNANHGDDPAGDPDIAFRYLSPGMIEAYEIYEDEE